MGSQERGEVAGIPLTSVPRTLLDLAEVVNEQELEKAFEEADRLGLLEMRPLEEVCAGARGRRGLKPLRRLIEEARAPEIGRSRLEDRVLALCREYDLPSPQINVEVDGREVDAFWPRERLMVEADSWSFHGHRAAFERDRARDAAVQADGYRVVRLTHWRMEREPGRVAAELRSLLEKSPGDVPALRPPYGLSTAGTSRADERGERGQGTVEWVALIAVVALLLLALVAAGARVPGSELARVIGSKLLCAAALAENCGDEPALIAAYGSEVGRLVRAHMPSIAFERGAKALPVDFRQCRSSACGDGSARGLVERTDRGLPITAFVHVVDCRDAGAASAGATGPVERLPEATDEAEDPTAVESSDPECSGERAGNLYLQYWLYYADSATLRGVPIAGPAGYHRDDWESVQVRVGRDGDVDERASSHHGYNHSRGLANAASDAGIDSLNGVVEAVGARPRNGWGPSHGLLRVSGGSHAGNASGYLDFDRIAPAHRIHLVPLEPVAAVAAGYRFAVSPPWRKRAWRDPEADGTE
jgi:Protein of unknown function (DUF559)